ncbi:helix-turn-helix domain-containing protein [Sneathiella sp.]|uniref:helix-turn-helix domain-containing protein n=1 Tax=Sneathiella sp. TaxID=1964365 RepID=UPI002FE31BAD
MRPSKALAERVAERRKEIGMSQRQAADACGVSPQQWNKYERATNHISVVMVTRIAEAFDVPISYFFASFGPTFDWEHELLIAWRSLPAPKRLMATNFVKAMATSSKGGDDENKN